MVKEEEWAEGVIGVLILKTPEIADMLKVNYIKKICTVYKVVIIMDIWTIVLTFYDKECS